MNTVSSTHSSGPQVYLHVHILCALRAVLLSVRGVLLPVRAVFLPVSGVLVPV